MQYTKRVKRARAFAQVLASVPGLEQVARVLRVHDASEEQRLVEGLDALRGTWAGRFAANLAGPAREELSDGPLRQALAMLGPEGIEDLGLLAFDGPSGRERLRALAGDDLVVPAAGVLAGQLAADLPELARRAEAAWEDAREGELGRQRWRLGRAPRPEELPDADAGTAGPAPPAPTAGEVAAWLTRALRLTRDDVTPDAAAELREATLGALLAELRIPLDDLLEPPYRSLPEGFLPSHLLRAEHGVVPFLFRDREMAELRAWCAGEPRLAVRLVTGPGGSGKSRLARELCHRMECAEPPWRVGLVRREADAEPGSAAARVLDARDVRTLIVVDYAETRLDFVAGLLKRLARGDRSQPVRVVLLARTAGDWWTRLADEPELAHLLHGALLPLERVAVGAEERRAIFDVGRDAFRAHVPYDGRPQPRPSDLETDERYGRSLMILFSALLAASGEAPPPAEELTRKMLAHERRYWEARRKNEGLGADYDRGIARCVAAITLRGGEQRALAVVKAVLGPDERPLVAEQVFDVVSTLYLHDGVVEALLPDLLGEELVLECLAQLDQTAGDAGRLVRQALDGASEEQALQAFTVLDRLARRPDDDAAKAPGWLQDAVTEHLAAHPGAATAAAQQDVERWLPLLEGALPRVDDASALARLAGSLPRYHTGLLAWAVAVAQRLEQRLPAGQGDGADATRAGVLGDLGVRLSEHGRKGEALPPTEEAVAIRRRLAARAPEAFEPDLAMSLNNLGLLLSELGRQDEALRPTEEAVAIYRRLAVRAPETFEHDLAGSLNNLGARLSELGRRAEALPPTEEAVAIQRRLAARDPDGVERDLAGSLNNLGLTLAGLGQSGAALPPIDEAVAIFRRLAARAPEAFEPDLSSCLNNLGGLLAQLGRRDEALSPTEEASAIRRRLAARAPEAFEPYLAGSLNNLGLLLSELGRKHEALPPTEEAVAIRRRLAARAPEAFDPHLATSLSNLGMLLTDLGRNDEALRPTEEAVAIRRRLAARISESFEPDLAVSLHNLGALLSRLGQKAEALPSTQEAVAIRRRLAAGHPETFEAGLANSLSNLGLLLSELGREGEALRPTEEAVRLLLPAFERQPRAYSRWMHILLRNLLERSEEAGVEPDVALLARIAAVFEDLEGA